jgi:hypothetical protein
MDHSTYSDTEFAERFLACMLDPALFTHEAHLRLGWILVREHGVEQASVILCEAIARFDRTFGSGTKFNRTITVASARMLAHFMARSTSTDFRTFITKFPRLRTHFRDLLDAHYSDRAYATPQAAVTFVEPDLLPF